MGVLLCGPRRVVTVATRYCPACQNETSQVIEWRGIGYGHDRHCLTCRVTDADGFPSTPDTASLARWDVLAAHPLPVDLFDAYVDADLAMYGSYDPALSTEDAIAEETRRSQALADIDDRVVDHWATGRQEAA